MDNKKLKMCFTTVLAAAALVFTGCSNMKDSPIESNTVSVEDGIVSTEDSTVTTESSTVTTESSTVTTESSTVTTEESTVPKEDEDTLVSDESSLQQTQTSVTDTEVKQTEPSEPRTPDFAFDTEFIAEKGREYCVGRDGIFVTVNNIEHYESTGYVGISYSMSIDGTAYTGDWSKFSDGNIINHSQSDFTTNILSVHSTDSDAKTVTISISSEYKVKEPVELSGNYSDTYSFSEPWYTESEDVIIFVDKGIEIHGDMMNRLSEIMDLIEQETGLLYSGVPGLTTGHRYDLELAFGEEFTGVDYKMEKFHVHVTDNSSPCGTNSFMVLNSMDIDFNTDVSVVVHELTHVIHQRNYLYVGQKLTEGLATYMSDRLLSSYPDKLPSVFKTESNYSSYNEVITAENAEELFKAVPEDTFDDYLYGYRFVHFLFAEYGDNIFKDIASLFTEHEENLSFDITEDAEVVDEIKACTSEDVFEKFALWLSEHQEMFDGI